MRSNTIDALQACYHRFWKAVQPRPSCPQFARVPFILAFLLTLHTFACALSAQTSSTEVASLEDAIRQLADRVASVPGLRGPLRLDCLRNGDAGSDDNKEWQETFRRELEKHHLSVTQEPGTALLRAGLTETPTQLVLAASVQVGVKDEVRLIAFPRVIFRRPNLPVVPVRVEKQLVYESSNHIIDASSQRNGTEAGLFLLAFEGADLYVERLDATGALKQSVSLAAVVVRPSRDVRAELVVRDEDATVALPGKICEFSWAGSGELKCRAAKPAWRGATLLTPNCDAGSWKLQPDGTDWTTPGLLQVMPVESPQKGSSGMLSDFPGPILSINGQQNPASALVVTRNLRTGNYEVYRVTLVCGS